jgi:hypothetical protein
MPYPSQSDEEFTQVSGNPNSVTPTKQQRHAGASHDQPDAEILESQYDSN